MTEPAADAGKVSTTRNTSDSNTSDSNTSAGRSGESIGSACNSLSTPRRSADTLRCNRLLVLGGGTGWHAEQLRAAARRQNVEIASASYESIQAGVGGDASHRNASHTCTAGAMETFDVILTRTMPAGSLEQITFRLATLHALGAAGAAIINSPSSLEIAIDKYATLAVAERLGYRVPETLVVQSRDAAMAAFDRLGGDVVVKPLFGGEGRGVMRVADRELAWTTFSTLERLDAILYVQRFLPPGGRDTRLLVIGERIWGVHRTSERDFRTNVAAGGRCHAATPTRVQRELARRLTEAIGLQFAAVDVIDTDDGPVVIEVNGIPGWRGAQSVTNDSIADAVIDSLRSAAIAPHRPNSMLHRDDTNAAPPPNVSKPDSSIPKCQAKP